MKKISIRIVLMAGLMILLYGCPKDPYYMYTHISPDGSCYRELIRNVDSAFVASLDTAHNPFPMKLDSSWKVTIYKRIKNDSAQLQNFPASTKYVKDSVEYAWFAKAVKHYETVNDLGQDFRFNHSSWESVEPEIVFRKKFCWFYTYYDFKETYRSFNPFKLVPVSAYLSPMEVAALYGEDKELYRGKNGLEIKNILQDLEDKADEWLEHNIYEEFFQTYLQHYNQFKNPPVDSAAFASQKDSIYNKYILKDTFEIDNIGELLNMHFKTKVYLTDSIGDFDKIFEEKFPEFLKYSDVELDYKMSMPGKIIETNAPFLSNDTLTWRIEDDRFFHTDYHLKAKSRKPNYWAFGVTGLIIALSVLGFWVRKK